MSPLRDNVLGRIFYRAFFHLTPVNADFAGDFPSAHPCLISVSINHHTIVGLRESGGGGGVLPAEWMKQM